MISTKVGFSANLARLTTGAWFGQGLLLLATTSLVARGHPDLAGGLALGLSMATLGLQVVDFGGNVALARVSATAGDLSAVFLAGVFRVRAMAIGLVIVLILAWTILDLRSGGQFGLTTGVVLGALPGLMFWRRNLIGALDGMGASGVAGLSGIPQWFLAAVAVFLSPRLPWNPGGWVGAFFSVGLIVSVALQRSAFQRLRTSAPLASPPSFLREGGANLIASIPGQLYNRAFLILAASFFPSASLGHVAVLQQVTNGFSQVTDFGRRAVFPRLVDGVQASLGFSRLLRRQKPLFVVGFLASLGTWGLILSLNSIGPGDLSQLPRHGVVYGAVVLLGAARAASSSVLQVTDRAPQLAAASHVALAIGLIATVVAVDLYGLLGLGIGWCFFEVAQTACIVSAWLHSGSGVGV